MVALAALLVEGRLSRVNALHLRRRGAVDAPDPTYRTVQWAYPACLVTMTIEGLVWGPAPGVTTWAGAILFASAKALKVWVIAALGRRWTYRLVVVPGEPLVTTGPYALMRHPNYVAVIGELTGMALLVGAAVAGPMAVVAYATLLRRRALAEERALQYQR